jgi:hypothetical protein
VSRFDDKFDGSSYILFNCHVSEFGHKKYLDAILAEIPGCQDKGFHGLVDCSRTDRLQRLTYETGAQVLQKIVLASLVTAARFGFVLFDVKSRLYLSKSNNWPKCFWLKRPTGI